MPFFNFSLKPSISKLQARRDTSALIKALSYRQDEEVREGAAEALGKLKEKTAVEPLLLALKDPNGRVVRSAARALGEIGDNRAFEPLISLLKVDSIPLCYTAVESIGQIGDPRAADALILLLDEIKKAIPIKKDRFLNTPAMDMLPLYRKTVETLGSLGNEHALPPLLEVASSCDGECKQAALQALEQLGCGSRKDQLGVRYWIEKGDWEKCVEIGSPAVQGLIRVLADEPNRAAAAEALGKIGDPVAIESLVNVLASSQKETRRMVIQALDQLRWRPGMDANGAYYWIFKGQWDACVEIGEAAITPLSMELNDPENGAAAEEAIRKIGKALADPELLLEASASYEKKRCERIDQLTSILRGMVFGQSDSAAQELYEMGWHPEPDETGAAYWANQLRWEKCIEIGNLTPLKLILMNRWPQGYLAGVIQALGDANDRSSIEYLVGFLNEPELEYTVAVALGKLGDIRGIRALMFSRGLGSHPCIKNFPGWDQVKKDVLMSVSRNGTMQAVEEVKTCYDTWISSDLFGHEWIEDRNHLVEEAMGIVSQA